MTPEARRRIESLRNAAERSERHGHGDLYGWARAVLAVLDLLPAAGEALVLGPEGWEKRRILGEEAVARDCVETLYLIKKKGRP